MASSTNCAGEEEVEAMVASTNKKCQELMSTLPREKSWVSEYQYLYQGFWLSELGFCGTLLAQRYFLSSPSDIVLATLPKSGSTWLKALVFTIFNRRSRTLNYNNDSPHHDHDHDYDHDHHPFQSTNPHDLVPILEHLVKDNPTSLKRGLPLCSTHLAFSSLPDSILASGCRIVYIYRDPKDVFISWWHFAPKLRPKELSPLSMEEMFEMFARGVCPYGPLWDHVLGYWKASLEWPNRVLFLKYEEMKRDTAVHVKRLAEFIGRPFSPEEESAGEVERIISLCGFEKMKNLEVNKSGKRNLQSKVEFLNKVYFRKGEVGDWENHLTAEMVERLNQITEMKFKGTPLF